MALAHAYQVLQAFKPSKAEKLKALFSAARSRTVNRKEVKGRIKAPKVTVAFAWYNYDKKKDRFVQVREVAGGGRRMQLMSRSTSLHEIEVVAKKLFFPNGKSSRGKKLSEHSYYLADFALN